MGVGGPLWLPQQLWVGCAAQAWPPPAPRRNARRNWTAENHIYNMLHRGFTSEPGGHAECCLDFYKTWVNNPAEAKALSEALTRDADAPEDATYPNVSVMAPSKLALATLGKAPKAAAAANGTASGVH